MEKIENKHRVLFRYLIMGASGVIIIAGIREISELVNIILLSILLAQGVHPLVQRLNRYGLPIWGSILVTILSLVIICVMVVELVANSVSDIRANSYHYEVRINEMINYLCVFFEDKGVNINPVLSSDHSSQLMSFMRQMVIELGSIVSNAVFVFIFMIFFLLEFNTIQHKVNKNAYPMGSFMYQIEAMNKTSSRYISIMALTGFIQAVLSTVILLILQVDFALTWGVLLFLCSFIPVLGIFLVLIPMGFIAFLGQGFTVAFIAVASWSAINLIFDNWVKPRFLRKEFSSSELYTLLILAFWSYILGVVGALIAVPLSISLKNIYDSLCNIEENAE